MQSVSEETSAQDYDVVVVGGADLGGGGFDKPWTVRGVPPEARNAAIAAAKRAEVNIGAWLTRAVRVAVKAEREESRAVAKIGAARLRCARCPTFRRQWTWRCSSARRQASRYHVGCRGRSSGN